MHLPNIKDLTKYFFLIIFGTAFGSGFLTMVSYAANFVISKI